MYRCADILLKIQVSAIRRHVVLHVIIDVPKMLSTCTWKRMTYNVFLDFIFITAVGTWWIVRDIDLLCWYLKYTYVGIWWMQ